MHTINSFNYLSIASHMSSSSNNIVKTFLFVSWKHFGSCSRKKNCFQFLDIWPQEVPCWGLLNRLLSLTHVNVKRNQKFIARRLSGRMLDKFEAIYDVFHCFPRSTAQHKSLLSQFPGQFRLSHLRNYVKWSAFWELLPISNSDTYFDYDWMKATSQHVALHSSLSLSQVVCLFTL